MKRKKKNPSLKQLSSKITNNKSKPLFVRISEESFTYLDSISNKYKVSKSALIEEMLKNYVSFQR